MSTTLGSFKSTAHGHDALWAAWGVLAVVLLALGASLIFIQTPPEEPSLAVLPAIEPAAAQTSETNAAPAVPAPTTRRRAGR
jgi:hypothetical protein